MEKIYINHFSEETESVYFYDLIKHTQMERKGGKVGNKLELHIIPKIVYYISQ